MHSVGIPYHLVLPFILVLTVLVFIIINRKILFEKRKLFWICVSIALLCYTVFVGGSAIEDMCSEWTLNKYDLDGDGVFAGNEITRDQIKAMDRVTNDTGVVFAPLVGLVLSGLLFLTLFIGGKLILYIRKITKKHA